MAYTTGQGLLALVLEKAHELGVGSADWELVAKDALNTAHLDLLRAFPWLFGKKTPPGVLTTSAEITTGTVTVTAGSINITFTAAPAASVATWRFYVVGDSLGTIYRINTHTAASTAAVLDSVYVNTDYAGAGKSFVLFQDEYGLASDFLLPTSRSGFLRDMQGLRRIDLINEDELAGRFPYPQQASSGWPRVATLVAPQRVRLWPYPTEQRRYEYAYQYHPGVLTFDGVAATDTPLISPAEDRIVLVDLAVGIILADKEDPRGPSYEARAAQRIRRMQGAQLRGQRPRTWVRRGQSIGAGT
jgi:hypothetical protein